MHLGGNRRWVPLGSQLCTGETRRTMFSRIVKLIGEWIAIYKGYSTHSTCSERSVLLLLEHFILLHSSLSPIPAACFPTPPVSHSAMNLQSSCDCGQEFVIVFCTIFGLFFVMVVFFNLFKCETFFLVNYKSYWGA